MPGGIRSPAWGVLSLDPLLAAPAGAGGETALLTQTAAWARGRGSRRALSHSEPKPRFSGCKDEG